MKLKNIDTDKLITNKEENTDKLSVSIAEAGSCGLYSDSLTGNHIIHEKTLANTQSGHYRNCVDHINGLSNESLAVCLC